MCILRLIDHLCLVSTETEFVENRSPLTLTYESLTHLEPFDTACLAKQERPGLRQENTSDHDGLLPVTS